MSIPVLLVDDEKDFADYTAKRLKARGIQAQVAYSGSSALALIAEHPVDVVLLDLRMPSMDGFEVLREISKARPEARVIILSGQIDPDAVKAAEALGAVDYLLKPLEFTTLLKAINDADRQCLRGLVPLDD